MSTTTVARRRVIKSATSLANLQVADRAQAVLRARDAGLG
jgi:hypothetical protein